MKRKLFTSILLCALNLTLASPIPLHTWVLGPQGLTRASIPAGIESISAETQADLDRDGQIESLSLASGEAEIDSGGNVVWQSPAGWKVIQAQFADLNQDGLPEVTLLVWRPFQPWPVDQWLPHGGRIDTFHDANGDSCHMIMIGWRDGRYQEIWAGSAMAEPVTAFAAVDLDGNGSQELITLENRYSDSRSSPARALKVWDWNGFGFTVVNTLTASIAKIAIAQAGDGRMLILIP